MQFKDSLVSAIGNWFRQGRFRWWRPGGERSRHKRRDWDWAHASRYTHGRSTCIGQVSLQSSTGTYLITSFSTISSWLHFYRAAKLVRLSSAACKWTVPLASQAPWCGFALSTRRWFKNGTSKTSKQRGAIKKVLDALKEVADRIPWYLGNISSYLWFI